MKKLFIAFVLLSTQAAESKICGTFELMRSCGQFTVLVPKLTTEDNVTYRLHGQCEQDDFQCMLDKYRILHESLESGKEYCFTGEVDPHPRASCTDFVWHFNDVYPIE